MQNANILLALSIARRFKIFPCSGWKTPRVEHWKEQSTQDTEKIIAWYSGKSELLIGIPAKLNNLLVVDVDRKDGRDGEISLNRFRQGQALNVGPAQKTPSGGYHLIYEYPAGMTIPNNSDQLGDGLDIRSDGYFCTGRGYVWVIDHSYDAPLTPLPGWLRTAIQAMIDKKSQPTTQRVPASPPADLADLTGSILKYYSRSARIGSRNLCAFLMGIQLHSADISPFEAENIARRYAQAVPDPSSFPEEEAIKAVESAYKSTEKRRQPWGAQW